VKNSKPVSFIRGHTPERRNAFTWRSPSPRSRIRGPLTCLAAAYPLSVADWVTISSLATAGGTLVLATATFASVRSANRAARVAEEALLVGIRPLLMPSRPEDPPVKVSFVDDHYVRTPGGGATAEVTDEAIYLTMSVRNTGTGIAVLAGWRHEPSREPHELADAAHPPLDGFRRLTRDLYVGPGDISFWQGAFRDPTEPEFADVAARITARERIVIDVLYGNHEGTERVISRFMLRPRGDGAWMATVVRHWNVDRPDPR
jgi:hypothetical protein